MITKSARRFRFITAFLVVTLGVALVPLNALGDGNVFTDPDKFSIWQVVGPNGGDVRAVTIDPRDKNRLYISTMDGQIHTSVDGGKSWAILASLEQPQLI